MIRWRRPAQTHWTAPWLMALLLLFFAAFLLYPAAFLLKNAFISGHVFSFKYFYLLLSSPLQREALGNSFFIAIATTLGATLLSLPLAHGLTRFQFRGKALLGALLLVPMVMPPFVGAIGLRQLLGRYGSLNLLLMKYGGLSPSHPIDWLGESGLWGVIFLQVLNLYPILLLNVTAAMANIDPALREAAQSLGAGGWRLFRTITLPLILPGYFAGAILVFIWAFTDLGTPLVFNVARVVPVQIFDSLSDLNTNPQGYALVVLVMLLSIALFLVSKRALAGRRYEMMARGHTGSGEAIAGGWQTAGIWAGMGGVVLIALLPHVMVIIQSFSTQWFMSIAPGGMTLDFYRDVFGHGLTFSSIRNSLFYSSLSAGLDLVLGVAIAWILTRQKLPGSELLDVLAMLPLALPGLVLAFGYVAGFDWQIAWLNPRQNPTLLLIVSYSVRRLPYIVRSAYAGFQQMSITLEEASANLGATPWRTLRRITLPLIMAHLIAGTVLTFSFAMLEVSDSLLLAMREAYFPITKMIWQLLGRIDPNAPSAACALGVVGIVILTASLLVAARVMGKNLGQLFRS